MRYFNPYLLRKYADDAPEFEQYKPSVIDNLFRQFMFHSGFMDADTLDRVAKDYASRQTEVLRMRQRAIEDNAQSAWSKYGLPVGGGAVLGGTIGGMIGHEKGNTLLGTLIGAGTGAGAGGLGRYLYDRFKRYKREKRYAELTSKPFL